MPTQLQLCRFRQELIYHGIRRYHCRMERLPTIRLNPSAEIRRQDIADDAFCVIVDDFLEDPDALIDFAADNAEQFSMPERSYPGMMMRLETAALADFDRFVRNRMGRTFSFLRSNASLSTGLSMVTLKPEELTNYQRLCHTDPRSDMSRRNYAALVYLYENEALGGTAFYRLKRPDIVYRALELDMQDPAAASAFLAEHTEVFRQPPCYISTSNELVELVHVVQPRFNRFVFYSGEIAHSAHITSPELLTRNFRKGRLTLNCFASVVPK